MMPFKKGKKKKNIELNRIKFLNIKKVDLKKFKVNPTNIIENTKNKIENLYVNFKEQRKKNKQKKEIQKKLDEKKEIQRLRRLEKKEKLNKIKD